MPRCTYCRAFLGHDYDRVAARCPSCRQPVHEAPRDPHQRVPGAANDACCAVHASNPAVGNCERCGNFHCTVCRTRWHDRFICVACVERALDTKEGVPAEVRAHLRQAILALVFGGVAWATFILGFILLLQAAALLPRSGMGYAVLGSLMLFGSPPLAALGLGQAVAALRTRGDHMVLATIGLFLSGLQAAVVIGLITASAVLQGGV